MTLERRSGSAGGRYLYRAKREGNRVRKEYIGACSDPVVALMARKDRLRKAETQARREAVAREQDWYAAVDALLQQYGAQMDATLAAWMDTRGYRRSRSGDWQPIIRRRKTAMDKGDFLALVKRAEQGTEEAAEEIRELMENDIDTWRPFGDLSHHVKQLFLDQVAAENVLVRESLKLRLDRLKADLLAKDNSPIRELLVDQVILCWLDVNYQQILAFRGGDSKTTAERLKRRLDASQKRYLAVLETIAKVDETLSEGVLPLSKAFEGDDS